MRVRMVAALAVMASVVFMSSPCWANNNDLYIGQPRIGLFQDEEGGVDITITLLGRASSLSGDVDADIGMGYGDLFDSGAGFTLEGAALWNATQFCKLGPYFSFGWDGYGGETFFDDYGNSLEADNLYSVTFIIGGEGQADLGAGFYVDMHLGLGLVSYSDVNGILTIIGIPIGVEVFDGGISIAFDFGARLGFNISNILFIEIGFGLRVQGPPQEADIDFNMESPSMAAFEFGAGLRF